MVEFKLPFKNLVPSMTTEEYESLKDSIATYGYWGNKKIEVTEDYEVLAGHHRLRVCKELGIEPPFIVNDKLKTNKEKKMYVVQENVLNRNLNSFQRVEAISKVVEFDHLSKRKMSLLSSVPQTACYESTIILKHGTEEEKRKVRYGKSAIHPLYLKIKKRINTAHNDKSEEDKPPKEPKKKITEGLLSGIIECPNCNTEISLPEKKKTTQELTKLEMLDRLTQWIFPELETAPIVTKDERLLLLILRDGLNKFFKGD